MSELTDEADLLMVSQFIEENWFEFIRHVEQTGGDEAQAEEILNRIKNKTGIS